MLVTMLHFVVVESNGVNGHVQQCTCKCMFCKFHTVQESLDSKHNVISSQFQSNWVQASDMLSVLLKKVN